MADKSKTFLGIGLVILCLLAATFSITSCSSPETENSQTVPQSTQDTTIPNNAATEKPIESTATSSVQEDIISSDAAKKIALDHANVTESDTKRLKIDLDYEDGIRIYEIDFIAGGFEYDYDINAKTGEIMKFDKGKD